MMRRSIRIVEEVHERVSAFCQENGISISSFLEERIEEYLSDLSPYRERANDQQPWILHVSYDGKRDRGKEEEIEISVGRRGATSSYGLAFIFDNPRMPNMLIAKRAEKRVLAGVCDVKTEARKYGVE